MSGKMQISTNGPYGVNDDMKNGVGLFSYQLDAPTLVHQLDKSEKLHRIKARNSVDLMSIPFSVSAQFSRLGGLKASNLINEILSSKIDIIDTKDIFSSIEAEI